MSRLRNDSELVQIYATPSTQEAYMVAQLAHLQSLLSHSQIESSIKRVSDKYSGLFVQKRDYYDAITICSSFLSAQAEEHIVWNVVEISPYNSKMVVRNNEPRPHVAQRTPAYMRMYKIDVNELNDMKRG